VLAVREGGKVIELKLKPSRTLDPDELTVTEYEAELFSRTLTLRLTVPQALGLIGEALAQVNDETDQNLVLYEP
jgi:hypothetical protein